MLHVLLCMKNIVLVLVFGFFLTPAFGSGEKNLSKDLSCYRYVVTSSLSCEAEMLGVVWKTLMSLFL